MPNVSDDEMRAARFPGAAKIPDTGFKTVVSQIVAERAAPKTMTLVITVEATRPVIDDFAASAKSAQGELTELGFALRDLANYSRGGKVRLGLKTDTITPFDFK